MKILLKSLLIFMLIGHGKLLAQSVNTPLSSSSSVQAVGPNVLHTLSAPAADWVIDIGYCLTAPCIADGTPDDPIVGKFVKFDFRSSQAIQQADTSIGSGNAASWGQWNFSGAKKLTFFLRPRVARCVAGVGGCPSAATFDFEGYPYWYMLVYDERKCYRQWLISHPAVNAGQKLTNTWHKITVDINIAHKNGPYSTENTPLGSICESASNFRLNRIVYFEIGMYGPNVQKDGAYGYDIGPVYLTR